MDLMKNKMTLDVKKIWQAWGKGISFLNDIQNSVMFLHQQFHIFVADLRLDLFGSYTGI